MRIVVAGSPLGWVLEIHVVIAKDVCIMITT